MGPYSVDIRSKWGYAFNGELEELQRMKITKPFDPATFMFRKVNFWDEGLHANVLFNNPGDEGTSAALFALANEQYDVVEWLESQGAKAHIKLFEKDGGFPKRDKAFARKYMY